MNEAEVGRHRRDEVRRRVHVHTGRAQRRWWRRYNAGVSVRRLAARQPRRRPPWRWWEPRTLEPYDPETMD